MDAVTISHLIVPVRIGHTPEERSEPQRVRIDLWIRTDFTAVLETGDLERGVDYSKIRRFIQTIADSDEFVLLENFGDVILRGIFEKPNILLAKIAIKKIDRWKDATPGIFMARMNR